MPKVVYVVWGSSIDEELPLYYASSLQLAELYRDSVAETFQYERLTITAELVDGEF